MPTEPGVYLFKDAQGARHLRRQGAEPAHARAPVLPPGGDERFFVAAARAHPSATSRPSSSTREGGAAPREQPHQAASAALQRQAARRQAVPGAAPRSARPRCPARSRSRARIGNGRRELLRPVSLGDLVRADAARRQPPLPAAHLHRSRAQLAQAAVPAVPDQALLGAVRASRSPTRSTPSRSRTWRCSSTARTTSWSSGCARA